MTITLLVAAFVIWHEAGCGAPPTSKAALEAAKNVDLSTATRATVTLVEITFTPGGGSTPERKESEVSVLITLDGKLLVSSDPLLTRSLGPQVGTYFYPLKSGEGERLDDLYFEIIRGTDALAVPELQPIGRRPLSF